ncbi:hypothetical protein [Akkermansia sp.]|uniref:hypothetical protein n=1 Tax=Akkermansia sp. TaxID=1872421 RepID=UPI002582CF6B|nr:hypothetical protein [Akkermansia sp.]MCD8320274.1 hypothetical protein [Akkermansia sp.]
MTKIEVKDYGFQTLLTIWTGTVRGGAAILVYLTPKQRQQLIKALQNPGHDQ